VEKERKRDREGGRGRWCEREQEKEREQEREKERKRKGSEREKRKREKRKLKKRNKGNYFLLHLFSFFLFQKKTIAFSRSFREGANAACSFLQSGARAREREKEKKKPPPLFLVALLIHLFLLAFFPTSSCSSTLPSLSYLLNPLPPPREVSTSVAFVFLLGTEPCEGFIALFWSFFCFF
jgi:hypothetical protein